MEVASPWQSSDSHKWLPALSIPTLSWAAPFVPLLGLPNTLLEHPEVWQSIYTQAANEHEIRLRAGDWAVGTEGGRGLLMRQVVRKALRQLAAHLGRDVAIDLERWVQFHFFCSEARSAMREWGVVISYAYLDENSRRGQRKVPPPAVMLPLLPDIWDLVNDERRREIRQTLMSVAPPPPYEQALWEKLEHCYEGYEATLISRCYEATLISWALDQALTLKALQTLAERLNPI